MASSGQQAIHMGLMVSQNYISRSCNYYNYDKGRVNPLDSSSIGAIAGFNINDGVTTVSQTLPNSGTDDIALLTTTSNVGNPGVWMFEVDAVEIGSKCMCGRNFPFYKVSRQWTHFLRGDP